MEGQKSGARDGRAPAAGDSYGSLMLQAAGVLRLRYVKCGRDTALSAEAATELATVFEGIAQGAPAFDHIDPKEAIALAHRLIDDDNPQLSHLWPQT
ncbi:hypothetical protein [Amycolatopsis saalfeldensis]|uniref:Uncharacterized protein n=1 Tax=Amycolatopsis saalfeldensis TaxID=394193 RepID=A0A1H8XZR0_9PSEU|nr:hypothetical protein [Amycolatopsis saalfeldensis]SEP45233.1 hypothetical protein SAMN04489732_1102 [Amycolatopsis saalfeldensis]